MMRISIAGLVFAAAVIYALVVYQPLAIMVMKNE